MIPQTQWKDHFLWWFHWVCGIIIPQTQWNQPLTKKVIFPLSLWNFNSTDSVESTTYQKVIFPLSLWNFNSTDSVESTTYQKVIFPLWNQQYSSLYASQTHITILIPKAHVLSTDAPVMTMTKTKRKTKTKWLKDPTYAIFLKMMLLKDINYNHNTYHPMMPLWWQWQRQTQRQRQRQRQRQND